MLRSMLRLKESAPSQIFVQVKRELEPLFVVQKCGKREPTLELLPDFCPSS